MPEQGGADVWRARAWPRWVLLALSVLALILGSLGIFTLHAAPALFLDEEGEYLLVGRDIQSLAHTPLEPTLLQNLPEFFTPTAEAHWWRHQEEIYKLLQEQPTVPVTWLGKDGALRTGTALVRVLPLGEVINRTWPLYLVAVLYLSSAVWVFCAQRSLAGMVLAFFFTACALYFTSAAPVMARPLTLSPLAFQLFITTLYVAAGGLLTLVHFAWIFPHPKPLLTRHPWLLKVLYGCFILSVVFYLYGLTAFGATFPLFCFWIGVVVWAFLHSFLTEPDPFLRVQIGLSLVAPVLACLFFVLFLLPGVLGLPQVRFTYFALFSLILPFALSSAMTNLTLYRERIEAERTAQQEKERFQQDSHDVVLHNLALISSSAQIGLEQVAHEHVGVQQQRLQKVRELAMDTAREFRALLRVLDDHYHSWDALCGQLRQWGNELSETFDFDFTFTVAEEIMQLPPPSLSLRVSLVRVYREALLNSIKHAQARSVQCSISYQAPMVCCELRDNGCGFSLDTPADGHFGLKIMHQRAKEVGGALSVDSRCGGGTRITLQIPTP